MLQMIDEDRKFWKGKTVDFHDFLRRDIVVIDDVFESTKRLLGRWAVITNINPVAMRFILVTLRRDAIRRFNKEMRGIDPKDIEAPLRKQYEMEKRHVDIIQEVESKAVRAGLGRTIGLRGVLSWNFRSEINL